MSAAVTSPGASSTFMSIELMLLAVTLLVLFAVCLPSGATAEQMNTHYEQFATLISESAAAGAPLTEWDKTERFLLGLGDDMDPLRFQYRLMPDAQRSWKNVVTIYKSFADSRQMKVDRDAAVAGSVAAIFPKGCATPSGKGDKGQKKPKPKGKGGKGGKGDKGKEEISPPVLTAGTPVTKRWTAGRRRVGSRPKLK